MDDVGGTCKAVPEGPLYACPVFVCTSYVVYLPWAYGFTPALYTLVDDGPSDDDDDVVVVEFKGAVGGGAVFFTSTVFPNLAVRAAFPTLEPNPSA